jgi:hypothetical protein
MECDLYSENMTLKYQYKKVKYVCLFSVYTFLPDMCEILWYAILLFKQKKVEILASVYCCSKQEVEMIYLLWYNSYM